MLARWSAKHVVHLAVQFALPRLDNGPNRVVRAGFHQRRDGTPQHTQIHPTRSWLPSSTRHLRRCATPNRRLWTACRFRVSEILYDFGDGGPLSPSPFTPLRRSIVVGCAQALAQVGQRAELHLVQLPRLCAWLLRLCSTHPAAGWATTCPYGGGARPRSSQVRRA